MEKANGEDRDCCHAANKMDRQDGPVGQTLAAAIRLTVSGPNVADSDG